MIIPFNYLINKKLNCSHLSNSGYYLNDSEIDNSVISILSLCILYHNDKISRKSFTSRVNKYKGHENFNDCHLSRKVNLHKSQLLDKFFTDTIITDVLLSEVILTTDFNNRDLDIELYLKYLNIGFSKNRNYCIDFISLNVFKPILNHYEQEFKYDFLKLSNIEGLDIKYTSYDDAERTGKLSFGYCCEDCDGCLSSYKKMNYENYFNKFDKEGLKGNILGIFLKMKKHLRNPNDKLILNF
jgi:hypothetical protein